jgi:hypothetical protein
MPSIILAGAARLAISITARVFTPFCAACCKALYFLRESWSGWGMSKKGYALALAVFALAGCAASPEAAQEAPVAAVAQQDAAPALSPRVRGPQVDRRPVQGQPQCNHHDEALAILQRRWGEQPVALGVTHNGQLVTVLESAGGATWSILLTAPSAGPGGGWACLVAAGQGWRTLPSGSRAPES